MRNRSTKQSDVLCPFYRSDDLQKRNVTCEGLADRSRIIQSFDFRRDYEQLVEQFCAGDYKNCEVYRMLLGSKYGE